MINSIKIKNFESHISTFVEFHPGVTVLIGKSDEGKSGIIRAIEWNIKNRPSGDSYRNDQLDPKNKKDKLKPTEVTIDYKDSNIISRVRDGGNTNHYQIGNMEPLRALRTDVPDEVKNESKMKSVNIQSQHPVDQYFMLADKPGAVAKQFNKVAGLTIMDDAIKSINSQIRSCNAEITVSQNEIENREEELKETKWVNKAQTIAKKLEGYQSKLKTINTRLNILIDIITSLEKTDKKLKQFDGIDESKIALDMLEDQKRNINETKNRKTSITNLILDIKSVDSHLDTMTDIDKAFMAVKSLEKLDADICVTDQKLSVINLIINGFVACTNKLDCAEKDYAIHLHKYEILREETECPTCGRKGK